MDQNIGSTDSLQVGSVIRRLTVEKTFLLHKHKPENIDGQSAFISGADEFAGHVQKEATRLHLLRKCGDGSVNAGTLLW